MKAIYPYSTMILVALCMGFSPPSLRPVESTPKAIGSLTFSAITQADWRMLDIPYPDGAAAILQLRIANRSETPVWFPTFDSMNPILTDPEDTRKPLGGGRDGTRVTPDILILPGKDYCYSLTAKTQKSRDGKGMELVIRDDTGMWFTAPMTPGKYQISFHLQAAHLDRSGKRKLEAPLWAAEGDTESVAFRAMVVTPAEN